MLSRTCRLRPSHSPSAAAANLKLHSHRRNLSVHEYLSMNILKDYTINIPRGKVARTPAEALAAARTLGSNGLVIKAQVLAGGRGKGHFASGLKGGVHIVDTPEEIRDLAGKMIGNRLITKQTGSAGKPCDTVYVVEKRKLEKEFYFAILMDRATKVSSIPLHCYGSLALTPG
eukprot:Partr_v1_DN25002_c0_g1_i2_m50992 putative beta' subunit